VGRPFFTQLPRRTLDSSNILSNIHARNPDRRRTGVATPVSKCVLTQTNTTAPPSIGLSRMCPSGTSAMKLQLLGILSRQLPPSGSPVRPLPRPELNFQAQRIVSVTGIVIISITRAMEKTRQTVEGTRNNYKQPRSRPCVNVQCRLGAGKSNSRQRASVLSPPTCHPCCKDIQLERVSDERD